MALNPSKKGVAAYRDLDHLSLPDLESIRLILQADSVIDWYRLSFVTDADIQEFLAVQEIDLEDTATRTRVSAIKNEAIGYLKRNFDFPVPKPVADADLPQLLLLASGKGHRQLCACVILKVMHIIHHLEARELLTMLPISDQDVFRLVEQKVFRIVGGMLAEGLPVLEFIGGRKNKDSLYSKLLSKKETHAAQIYDKLRFRIVTRSVDDVFPMLAYLTRRLIPFNYVVPGQSTNSLFNLGEYCSKNKRLRQLVHQVQTLPGDLSAHRVDNQFSAASYRVVHFVVDMPVRVPRDVLDLTPPAGWGLGQVVFSQAEFQLIDRVSENANERGDASHDAYKNRQQSAIKRRLQVGAGETAPAPRAKAKEPAKPSARITVRPPARKK